MSPPLAGAILLAFAVSNCATSEAVSGCAGNAEGLAGSCPAPQTTDGCRTFVAVTVSSGLSPRIAWSPQCGINHLVVREGSAFLQGRLVWSFSTAGRELIRPDVRYGVLPAGAILEGPTRPLESGRIYHVRLETLADVGGITGYGTATFRP